MSFNKALTVLTKFFALTPKDFEKLSKATIITWATRIKSEGSVYKLSLDEHRYLIGEIVKF